MELTRQASPREKHGVSLPMASGEKASCCLPGVCDVMGFEGNFL